MTLHCETAARDESLAAAIAQTVRDLCRVRGEVALVDPGSIANDGIVIEDRRDYD